MNRGRVKPGFQKAKMLETARRLFWEKGYNATSMREIAIAYGCRPANIYNFFSDNYKLIDAFVETTSMSSPAAAPPLVMSIPPAVVIIWNASAAVPSDERTRLEF